MAAEPPTGVHQQLLARILDSGGSAPQAWRRAAFDNAGSELDEVRAVVDRVANDPTGLTDDDFTRVIEAGLSGDQVWEIVICAAVGQASRQYEAALSALAAATEDRS